jgi:L-ascorbate metabolism protein UlaG (beta-lactamase superfamily)
MGEKAMLLRKRQTLKITEIGHATMLIEMAEMTILTDPWFTDPILGVVTHPHRLCMKVEDVPELDLILISHGHFDHCDLKAVARLNKSATVVVPEDGTARRIRKLGFSNVAVLSPWQTKKISNVTVSAFPADHPVSECTYVLSDADSAVYFGGDSRFIKEFQEIGRKFDLSVALLPVNGLCLPFVGKVVMDPVEAAEAAVQLKARVAIPIHCNISLIIPGLKTLFDRSAPGTPEIFASELRKRNRHVKVVPLKPGESWEKDKK